MELEVLKAIPGISQFGALVVIVVILLKFLSQLHKEVKELAASFMSEIKESRKDFQEQLRELGGTVSENQQHYQEQVTGLFENHMNLSRDTILTVKALEMTVRDVDLTVKELQNVVRSLPGLNPDHGPQRALPPGREPRDPRKPN